MHYSKAIGACSRYLLARLLNRRYPLYVSFYITFRCDLRCKYCSTWTHADKEMTTDQIKNMVDELAGLGMVQFGLTGGECTVRPDLGEIIRHARARKITVTATTNGGSFISKYDELKELSLLVISIDGPPDIHDGLRGKGSHKRALEAIRFAREKGMNVDINTVISARSAPTIPYMLDLAKQLDVTITFQPLFSYMLSAKMEVLDTMKPSRQQIDEVLDLLLRAKHGGAPIKNSASYFSHLRKNWPQGREMTCWAGRLFFNITPEGSVQQCCFLKDSQRWANGLHTSFADAIRAKPHLKCRGCFCNAYIEAHQALSLKPTAVLNVLKGV